MDSKLPSKYGRKEDSVALCVAEIYIIFSLVVIGFKSRYIFMCELDGHEDVEFLMVRGNGETKSPSQPSPSSIMTN